MHSMQKYKKSKGDMVAVALEVAILAKVVINSKDTQVKVDSAEVLAVREDRFVQEIKNLGMLVEIQEEDQTWDLSNQIRINSDKEPGECLEAEETKAVETRTKEDFLVKVLD